MIKLIVDNHLENISDISISSFLQYAVFDLLKVISMLFIPSVKIRQTNRQIVEAWYPPPTPACSLT